MKMAKSLIAVVAVFQVFVAFKSVASTGAGQKNAPLIPAYCYAVEAKGKTAVELRSMAQVCSEVGDIVAQALKEAAPNLTQEEVFEGLSDMQHFYSISNQYYFEATRAPLN